jgi:hypothetical protein
LVIIKDFALKEKRFGPVKGMRLPPYIHFLATEGGLDAMGVFYNILHIDDERLAEIFAREVLSFLVGREILSP